MTSLFDIDLGTVLVRRPSELSFSEWVDALEALVELGFYRVDYWPVTASDVCEVARLRGSESP